MLAESSSFSRQLFSRGTTEEPGWLFPTAVIVQPLPTLSGMNIRAISSSKTLQLLPQTMSDSHFY